MSFVLGVFEPVNPPKYAPGWDLPFFFCLIEMAPGGIQKASCVSHLCVSRATLKLRIVGSFPQISASLILRMEKTEELILCTFSKCCQLSCCLVHYALFSRHQISWPFLFLVEVIWLVSAIYSTIGSIPSLRRFPKLALASFRLPLLKLLEYLEVLFIYQICRFHDHTDICLELRLFLFIQLYFAVSSILCWYNM